MTTPISRLLACVAVAGLAAGCSGGGGSAVPAAAPAAPAGPQSGTSSVALAIVIPARAPAAAQRTPRHLPASVASMKIVVSQGATVASTTVVGLKPGDPNCSGPPGGPTTCTATLQVPIGSDTFELTSYDAAGALGNQISHAIVPKQIVAGSNSLPVTLNGIVKSISILTGAEGIYEGATFTLTAGVFAQDADNNTIVGTFDAPVTITADGTLITIPGGSAKVTSSSDTITFTYAIPDPLPAKYNGKATFDAGPSVFLQQPIIDNAKTLESETAHPGGLALWYDGADSATMLATGGAVVAPNGKVATWNDRNGSAHAVSQTTPGAQPVLAPGHFAHANKQGLAFTAGQFLAGTGFPAGAYTIIAVALGSGNPGTLVGGSGTAGTGAYALSIPAAGEIDLVQNGATGPKLTGIDITAPYYAIAKVAAGATPANGTGTLSYHGATAIPGPVSATVSTVMTNDPVVAINAASAAGAGSAANTIGEVIVLDHAATANEQVLYEEYLHRKWDI